MTFEIIDADGTKPQYIDGKEIYGCTHYVDFDGYVKDKYDWMLDNVALWYYDVQHEPMDRNGDCGGGELLTIYFTTIEDAMAFKLAWT